MDIGPTNTGYCHMNTDRAQFYFNKRLLVNTGEISSYSSAQLVLGTDNGTNDHVFVDSGSTTQVGIGNSSPGYTLDVDGITRSSAGLRLDPVPYANAGSSGTTQSQTITLDMGGLSYKTFIKTNSFLGNGIVNYSISNGIDGAQAIVVFKTSGSMATTRIYGYNDSQYVGSVYLGFADSIYVAANGANQVVMTFTNIGGTWYANAAVYDR